MHGADGRSRVVGNAALAIRNGGVIAYPTEHCYGLGCDPRHAGAVRRILRLKRRSHRQGLIIVAATLGQLRPWHRLDDDEIPAVVLESWPGPWTWLLPAAHWVPSLLRGEHERIAARVTAHPLTSALCRAAHTALVSTSANRHHRPPARTAARVRREFPRGVDLVVEGALGTLPAPTAIRDALTGALVRAGGSDAR